MKKLLLVAFVFCSLLASAQQESFEVFKWNEVEHPFNTKEEVYVDPDPDADEFGRIWDALDSKSEIKLQNRTDTTTIRVKKSTQHKTGYSYSPHNTFVNIDKNKAKWILVRGTKIIESVYNFDFYLIKHDTLGTDTYFLSNDLGLNIPTEFINGRIEVVGDKPLIITEERYVWEGYSPSTFPKYTYQTLINTQKGSLFAIPS